MIGSSHGCPIGSLSSPRPSGDPPLYSRPPLLSLRTASPRSPSSPPPGGCPSCTDRKFTLGLRAQRPAFPGRASRRACAGTRPKGAEWARVRDSPQKQEVGAAPIFKNLCCTARRGSSGIKHFAPTRLEGPRAALCGRRVNARHLTSKR